MKNMKNKYHNLAQLVTITIVSLILLSSVVVVGAAAETSPGLSKKELKTLLATAKTPADHQRLAAYYRDKAQRLTEKAQEFSAQADYLAKHLGLGRPASIELKQGISCNCTSHYRYFSKLYAQEAKDSELLAAQQEQLVSSQPAVCETAIGCKVTLKPPSQGQ
jgi:hypothetical protein